MAKYDIHDDQKIHQSASNALKDSELSNNNKKLIAEFIQDARDGYHNPEKDSGKAVGERKLSPYTYYLIKWSQALGKDWKEATDADIKNILAKLRDNKIQQTHTKEAYAEQTKFAMRILLKMFCRWLIGKHNVKLNYNIINVGSIKTQLPPYLEKSQVEKLVLGTGNIQYQALIMTLFDAGLRIEEALNLRLKDVNYLDTPNKNKIMRLDIRISKTEARNPELFMAQANVERWLAVHEQRNNPESFLFGMWQHNNGKREWSPLTYGAVRVYLRKLAFKVLPGTRVYPHLFRHSSATYYASKLNRQQLCLRYGWAFSSRMPDIYIRRSGIDNTAIIQQHENENMNELHKENQELRTQVEIMRADLAKVQDFMQFPQVQKWQKLLLKLKEQADAEKD